MDSPLKAALTGLELLLARAQLWQETAAKHVSLSAQLEAIASLAGRWRKLELASWRRLLQRTITLYAQGVNLRLQMCLNTLPLNHLFSNVTSISEYEQQ